jgi:hypothetical protein
MNDPTLPHPQEQSETLVFSLAHRTTRRTIYDANRTRRKN